jgi:anti-sigma-K factor RskA
VEEKDIISSGILEIYALGMASTAEAAEVEALLANSAEARDELSKIELSLENYALAHAVEPPQHLKQSILNKINPGGQDGIVRDISSSRNVVSMNPIWKYAAAASVILLLGSIALNLFFYDKVEKTTAAYNTSQLELLAANQALSELDNDMGVITNKYSKAVSLEGLPAAPDAAAKVFWIKNTGELYIDPSNLPAAPKGMQYQLWGIVDGKPVDAGMIITDKNDKKYGIQKMKSFGQAEAFAVTLETAGGKPQPEGEMYVMGKM